MEWVHSAMGNGGLYLLLFLSLMVVNLLPPIPAEAIIPMSASLFAHHAYSAPLAIIAATAGLVCGTVPWFYLGQSYGEDRFKTFLRGRRWLAVTPADVERSGRWFRRYGGVMVLVGRFIPGMRTLVSIPAGFHHMPLLSFMAWTVLGSTLWASFLITTGGWLSKIFPGVTALGVCLVLLVVFGALYCHRQKNQ